MRWQIAVPFPLSSDDQYLVKVTINYFRILFIKPTNTVNVTHELFWLTTLNEGFGTLATLR